MSSFKFKYDDTGYTRAGAKSIIINDNNDKAIRREYSRMRDVAQKRISRLANSKYANNQLSRQYEEGFPKLADIMSEKELLDAYVDIAWFIKQKKSSLSGNRAIENKTLNTYKRGGLGNIVNRGNIDQFNEFMGYVRSKYESYMLDSERVVDWFEQNSRFKNGKEKALSTIEKNFRKWSEEQFSE